MLSAIIMASGFSKRFGKEDKLLSKINNRYIIEIVCENALRSNLEEIILVYRNDKINEIISNKKISKIKNNNAEKGMSESLKLGIRNSSKNLTGYLFLMGDQPLVNKDIINTLVNTFNKNNQKIILPVFNSKKSSPTIFPVKYKNELLEIKGDVGGRLLIKKYFKEIIEVDFKNNKNKDVDKIEDVKITDKLFKKEN